MRTASAAIQELIDGASAVDVVVSPREIERYRGERLIPQPLVKSLGHGKGTQTSNTSGTLDQLLALTRALRVRRNFDEAAFKLWIDSWNIEPSRIRLVFSRLLDELKSGQLLSQNDPNHIRDKAEDIASSFLQGNQSRSSMARRSTIEEIQSLIEDGAAHALGGSDLHERNLNPHKTNWNFDKVIGLETATELFGATRFGVLDLAHYLIPGISWLTETDDVELEAFKGRYIGAMRLLRSPLLIALGLEELASRSFRELVSFDLLVFYALGALKVAHQDFDQRIDLVLKAMSI